MDRNASGRGARTFFCGVVLRRALVRLRLQLMVVSHKGSVVFHWTECVTQQQYVLWGVHCCLKN